MTWIGGRGLLSFIWVLWLCVAMGNMDGEMDSEGNACVQTLPDTNSVFFPDRMPKNRSRLLQMGFRNYLKYCKCYTFYFVIQLFSDPDKLEFKLSMPEQSMIAKFIQGM